MENEWKLPSCVDWAACEAECAEEAEAAELYRGLAESEAEDRGMDAYYRDRYGD